MLSTRSCSPWWTLIVRHVTAAGLVPEIAPPAPRRAPGPRPCPFDQITAYETIAISRSPHRKRERGCPPLFLRSSPHPRLTRPTRPASTRGWRSSLVARAYLRTQAGFHYIQFIQCYVRNYHGLRIQGDIGYTIQGTSFPPLFPRSPTLGTVAKSIKGFLEIVKNEELYSRIDKAMAVGRVGEIEHHFFVPNSDPFKALVGPVTEITSVFFPTHTILSCRSPLYSCPLLLHARCFLTFTLAPLVFTLRSPDAKGDFEVLAAKFHATLGGKMTHGWSGADPNTTIAIAAWDSVEAFTAFAEVPEAAEGLSIIRQMTEVKGPSLVTLTRTS
jgi:hypothetical protein